MIAIADTGPLNYLILIDEIEALQSLFSRVYVPASVFEELSRPGAPEVVSNWIAKPPAWLECRAPVMAPDARLAMLDSGERAVILVAEELKSGTLLLDDADARREAERRGLSLTGTLGVLAVGASKKLLDFDAAVNRLRQTSFRFSPETLERVRTQHNL